MNQLFHWLPLSAQSGGMMSWFGSRSLEHLIRSPLTVGVVGVLAVFAVVVCWIVIRYRQSNSKQPMDHPWRLLRELAQAHELRRSDERLLHQIVRRYGIEPPARLLLEPERFQAAAGDELFLRERQAILRLKSRLFDGH